ncbi:glycosyltransferase family 2 protein [uncultured Ruminococcus sp.]|uniref:glycosyltransferase family 2 protein n=1 Tax=uncultured Ruminococcus sp. TaxID=165186 RepID=UPI000EB94BC3|nr:glycosyltransferase family 2 protein [uncultured Ruminococcus sp.]HCJ41913.1 glycosyl transferase family 2 [Ruminococcus sp.]
MAALLTACVLSYNHEKWLRKCLESICTQKTDFEFTVLVHEDCSTDGSKAVVEEFEKKYPDKIQTIYQQENQYSKGINIVQKYVIPAIKTEYFAICEGDDYWCDENKLQKQVDHLRTHPECNMCFHNAKVVDTDDNFIKFFYPRKMWNDKALNKAMNDPAGADITVPELIKLDFTPTASTVGRTEKMRRLLEFSTSMDLVVRLVTTYDGKAHYFNEVMSAYRTNNPNSASGSIKTSAERLKKNFLDRHSSLLREFDKFTKGQYHSDIEHQIKRKELIYYQHLGDLKAMKATGVYNELIMYERVKYVVKDMLPFIMKFKKRK